MDTSDLSREAYDAVIIESGKFSGDLETHFGVLSYQCKDENEYLMEAKELIAGIRNMDEGDLEDLFFGKLPDRRKMMQALVKMIVKIDKVLAIPVKKRHFDF